jgi:CDP-diacylglycerol--glycerol-3-phosphate 3-phosphatidyltransferase
MNHSTSPETASQEKRTLTDTLRTRTHFIVDPVVSFLAQRGISPNLLTVSGMLAHFLVALLIARGQMQLAAVLLLLVAPLDALDGALARKLGREARDFGAFLDSTLDRLAEIVLFGGFLFYYARTGNQVMMATAYIGITGSLMVSYARARAEGLRIPCKIGLLSRVERYAILMVALLADRPAIGLIIVAILSYITVAQRVFHVWQRATKE